MAYRSRRTAMVNTSCFCISIISFTFFLELDRATEGGATLQDKIERYIQYAESGLYEKQFARVPFGFLSLRQLKDGCRVSSR